MAAAPGSVAALARGLRGASVPTSETAHQAGLLAQRTAEIVAERAASSDRASYIAQGDDVLSEWERMRRLEAAAMRRAEASWRSDSRRWGSHALAVAWFRASLGLALSPAERDILSSSELLAHSLPLDFGAAAIEDALQCGICL